MESRDTRYDAIVATLFDGFLQLIAKIDLKKKLPRVFLIYADESEDPGLRQKLPADAKVARQLIRWLSQSLEINIYSDRSKLGNFSDATDNRNLEDVLWSQLSLLIPGEIAISHVIVCGSSLLKSYTNWTFYNEYLIAIRSCLNSLGNEKKWTKELLLSSLSSIINEFQLKPDFHHVLTELIFLQIRKMSLSNHSQPQKIIPFLLNMNEEKNVLPEYILTHEAYIVKGIYRQPDKWCGINYTNEGLHLAFFELLIRLFCDQTDIVNEICYYQNKYKELLKLLNKKAISEESIKEKILRIEIKKERERLENRQYLDTAYDKGLNLNTQREINQLKNIDSYDSKNMQKNLLVKLNISKMDSQTDAISSQSSEMLYVQKLLQQSYQRNSKLTLFNDNKLISINKQYIDNALTHNGQLIPLEALFEFSKDNEIKLSKKKNRIIILGEAGIGKTTFCRYLAYQWALGEEGRLPFLAKKFDALFLIQLKNITKYTGNEVNIVNLIHKECLVDFDVSEMLKILAKDNPRILYILDGYDEIINFVKINEVHSKLLQELLAQENYILTSRPICIRGVKADRKLEIIGFKKKGIETYIKNFYKRKKQFEYAQIMFYMLKGDIAMNELAHNPLHLELICSVIRQGRTDYSPFNTITITQLYNELIRNLLQWDSEKSKVQCNLNAELEKIYQPTIEFIQKLAFVGLLSGEKKIKRKKIRLIMGKATSLDSCINTIIEIGLIRSNFEGIDEENRYYEFSHLTCQEFFASLYLVNCLINYSKIDASDVSISIEQFINENMYTVTWANVIGFTLGNLTRHYIPQVLNGFIHLLFSDDYQNSIDKIYSKLKWLNEVSYEDINFYNLNENIKIITLGDNILEILLDAKILADIKNLIKEKKLILLKKYFHFKMLFKSSRFGTV